MILQIPVYNQEGKRIGEEKLDPKIFGLEIKPQLIHRVVVSLLASQRYPWSHVKTRSDVAGGGKKPWRQKGTGRARAGSIRSPLWRGGGIIFGPTKERNYQQKINKKIKKQVFLMTLSDKVKEKKLYVLDKIEMPEIKTKDFNKILFNLISDYKKNRNRKILLALPEKDLNIIKSARNIAGVKSLPVENLNLLDCLKADYLLTTREGLKKIQKHFK